MFQKILKIFGIRKALTADQILRYPKPRQYTRDQHTLRVSHLDPDAVKVVQRIQQMGCRAYIVGGSIRDLLLGRKPKDYDVVTDAHPQELRRMFANSRIIGRRFRLVHVVFRGNKVIEVSTARSLPTNREQAKNSEELLLHRDNQFGTFKEDAARRDFTINALIFDIKNETIVDYAGGFEDIEARVVRVIGNPDISFPEDPVRMYRAVKFAALLGLDLDPATFRAIQKYKNLLTKASTSRLHEEYNKIFRSGHAAKVFASLNSSGLLQTLMPAVVRGEQLNPQLSDEDFMQTGLGRRLAIADLMIQEHEDVNLNIYYALLIAGSIYPTVLKNVRDHEKGLEKKLKDPLQALQKDVQLTKREYETMLQIFSTQNLFRKNVAERKGWVKEFQQRHIFQESFIAYKIISRAAEDDDALQKALFWEIGLRQKLPESIRKSTADRVVVDEKEYIAEPAQNNMSDQPRTRQGSGQPRKRNSRGRRPRRGKNNGTGRSNGNNVPDEAHAAAPENL
jgi:poly(A) polymerase